MAGTLDFKEKKIACPFCGEDVTITIVIDYDPKDRSTPIFRGISGGGTRCLECSKYIRDRDLE